MVKEIDFKIIANDNDITSKIKENLISISYTDYANDNSDEINISVAGAYKRPQYEDTLKLYIGYKNELVYVGCFVVQSSTIENNYLLSIKATATDFNNSLKEKKSKTFENLSIKDIATQIANIQSLECKSDLDDIHIISLAQTNESDINFLSRIAKEYNLIFNIKNNTLILKKRIKDNQISNELPKYTISINDTKSSSITHNNRTLYNSAKAIFRDTKENKDIEVIQGSKEPVLIVKDSYKSISEAKEKLKAKLTSANANTITGNINIMGEIIFAGGILTITDSLNDDGEYQITKVSHNISSSGWSTQIEFTK